MKRFPFLKSLLLPVILALLLVLPAAAGAGPPTPAADLASLSAESTMALRVTWDAQTGAPAFVAGRFPSGTPARGLAADPLDAARRFLARHHAAFGVVDPQLELSLLRADVDRLGMTHVRLQQTQHGVPVLGAQLVIHFDPSGEWVTAVNGDYLAGIELPTRKPAIAAPSARRIAEASLPNSVVWQRPRLVVADGRLNAALTGSHLAWLVELYDHNLPARNVYLIDAQSGRILDSYNRLATERDRRTYTAEHKQVLPGKLWLTEAGPVDGESPDEDGLNAHKFAGVTYDYFSGTHLRDSYDDAGATLVATVHYGNNYQNAFWNGLQMVYGDGFASADDVVAHELTHAVTESTADLVYRYQSGALNESFSDVFAAMVDNEDWLIGEDLPIGAIRSMANPSVFNQPGHLDEYNTTCNDNGGVHINSGIPNKVAYLMSEVLGRPATEQIFYRTLTYYLTSNATFNDARASTIQAAEDLFGAGSDEVKETTTAFNAVGLDGVRTPPEHVCDCAASLTLSDRALFDDVGFAVRATATLYRTRDELLSQTPAGQRYADLYYTHTGEISRLLVKEPALRAQAADLLRSVVPGLAALLDGRGDEVVVTPAMIAQTQSMLDGLAAAGEGELAKTIAVERAQLKLESLAGLTFAQAWQTINTTQ